MTFQNLNYTSPTWDASSFSLPGMDNLLSGIGQAATGSFTNPVTTNIQPSANAGSSLWGGMSDFLGGFLDTTDANGIKTQGWGMPVMSGLMGLGQSWLGAQQLSQARDQFNFGKDMAIKNYNQQASMLNAQLEDRQRARLGSSAETGNQYYRSVGDYMNTYGAKEYGDNG